MLRSNCRLTAVDVFAGAGGLSLGAQRAGFQVPVAVEINNRVTPTYRRNHPAATIIEDDVCAVKGEDILKSVPSGKVDLLLACAPCQGFCSLTIKNRRRDPRNALVSQVARLVEETRPSAVLMENVPGLATRGKRLLSKLIERLRAAGYKVGWWNVQMADYGIPQNRRRLVLLAGRGFEIEIPVPTHARLGTKSRKPWVTLREAIYGEKAPKALSAIRDHGGPQVENWHIVRDLQPETRERLRAATPGGMRVDLDNRLLPDCHKGGYEGFRNVYMRMSWDKPSPTITAGCTTPAKGRFGHPDRRRSTISVREAATIQTFPEHFVFETKKIDVACEMIGNAVPPLFAECVARHIRNSIVENCAR
ncbi:MAG: DNA cytosine methyltransferase [Pirellulales bacterium]